MSNFSEIRNHLEFASGEYIRSGYKSLAQQAIRERGRFEPEFGPEDYNRFVRCMMQLVPNVHDGKTHQSQLGIVAQEDADDPSVIFVIHKIDKMPIPAIKIKSNPEGNPDRRLFFPPSSPALLFTDANTSNGPTKTEIAGEEARQFCTEAFALYENSLGMTPLPTD